MRLFVYYCLSHSSSESNNVVRESLRLLLQMIHRKSNNGIAAMDTGVEGISPNYVRLMLSVDEPHDFLSPLTLVVKNLSGKVTQDPRTPYQVLCRAFGTLVAQDIFAVFISTTSTLSDYSPDDEAFWSYRGLTGETNPADLQAPFVELPFDTFASVTEGVTLESVASGAQMAQFGRPLYVVF